ncbi:MAG: alpha-glucan family phosphorylase [Myxococcota bacterium]
MALTQEAFLNQLYRIANNLWWTWNPDAQELFERIDKARWRAVKHNPIALLRQVPPEHMKRLADQPEMLAALDKVSTRLNDYLSDKKTRVATDYPQLADKGIGYFSAEVGLHESLPIYAGGLGVLAGDHIKSASDVGLPLFGMTLLYREGYFQQHIDSAWQRERYPRLDVDQFPGQLVRNPDNSPVEVVVDVGRRPVRLHIYRVNVGRVPLFLLDSDVPANDHAARRLCARLYGGDDHTRIAQEMILGIGGVRALRAMGIKPAVWHMNEGHCAFLALELARERMVQEGIKFEQAHRWVKERCLFTTHTPVQAGHDRFSAEILEDYLAVMRHDLGLSPTEFQALGKLDPKSQHERYCMTVVALKSSKHTNAVSELHGKVSRTMWRDLWPSLREDDVPIGHVTNGIHVPTWTAPRARKLLDQALGAEWWKRQDDPETFKKLDALPDDALWSMRNQLRRECIEELRQRLANILLYRGEGDSAVSEAATMLDPGALTIGFARRFATYKRAALLFSDISAATRIFGDPSRPVQVIFAGKAHPKDDAGKHEMQRVLHVAEDGRFKGKVIFMDDYDMELARLMVRGVDVWLNNPRRPREASGTSGQKVVAHGTLNCSILDGWWAEATDGTNGFNIGDSREVQDPIEQDRLDAGALYHTLITQVIPEFFDRDEKGIPRKWVARMRSSMKTNLPRYNTDRMVLDYVKQFYLPLSQEG